MHLSCFPLMALSFRSYMHFLLILSTLDDQNIHENAKICRNVMLLFGFTMRSAFKKVQNPSVG